METWDLKEMKLVIGPYILSDFEEGDVLVVTRDEVSFTKQIGATGEGSRSKTNNRAGKITVRLKQTSSQNASMSALMLADELTNSGVVPLVAMDNSGTDKHVAKYVWIEKPPDAAYGRDGGAREWVFDTDDVMMFLGGS